MHFPAFNFVTGTADGVTFWPEEGGGRVLLRPGQKPLLNAPCPARQDILWLGMLCPPHRPDPSYMRLMAQLLGVYAFFAPSPDDILWQVHALVAYVAPRDQTQRTCRPTRTEATPPWLQPAQPMKEVA